MKGFSFSLPSIFLLFQTLRESERMKTRVATTMWENPCLSVAAADVVVAVYDAAAAERGRMALVLAYRSKAHSIFKKGRCFG